MKLPLVLAVVSFACYTLLESSKCSIYDSECQRMFFQYQAITKATEGIKEIGLPVVDPFKVSNVSMGILDLWNMTLVSGEALGIRNCLLTKYEMNVEARYKDLELLCDEIVIKGQYKLTSIPNFVNAYADCVGDGNLTMTLENWYFKIKHPFRIVKEANGHIYVKALFEDAVYSAYVNNFYMQINGIKLGKCDISNYVTDFVNNKWQWIMASDMGNFINDKSMEYYCDIYDIFYNNLPASQYLSDDLSKLVDEDNYEHMS